MQWYDTVATPTNKYRSHAFSFSFFFTYLCYPDRLGVTGTNKLARIQRRRSVLVIICVPTTASEMMLSVQSSKEERLRPSRFLAYKVTIGLRAPRSLLSLMNLNVFLCLATPHGLTAWYGLTVQWGKRQGSATRPLNASLNAPLRVEQKKKKKSCWDRVIGVQNDSLLSLTVVPSSVWTTTVQQS